MAEPLYVTDGKTNGEIYVRYEFETFKELEEYFLENCFGVKGLRTKVIGKVLLVQSRKEM